MAMASLLFNGLSAGLLSIPSPMQDHLAIDALDIYGQPRFILTEMAKGLKANRLLHLPFAL